MRLSSLVTTSVALSMMDNIKVTCSAALPSTPSLLRGKNNEERKLEEENLPTFVSAWEEIPDLAFPLDVGESQGTMIGTDLYSVGGFFPGIQTGPMEGFALDLSDPTATWREMAPNPIDPFLTHAAQAVKGESKIYLCGGYLGGHPGRAIDDCYVFDKADGPMGNWTQLPSLPEPRAGGGMVYIESHDALVFALGAIRPINGSAASVDLDGTWMLELDNVTAGWQPRKTIPYRGNHVSSVVARDCAGEIHYLFLGGQIGERENDSNLPDMYEYLADTDEWVQRANMLEGRGHFTTSTVPYGCGFLVIGGAVNKNLNKFSKTDDISYYDASLDQWTSVGKLPRNYKTQVCGIYDDWLYCTCGYRVETYRRKLSFPVVPTPLPTIAPTLLSQPTSTPSIFPSITPSFEHSTLPSWPLESESSVAPSVAVSDAPSDAPSSSPTLALASESSVAPSVAVSDAPSNVQSTSPTLAAVSQSSMAPSVLGSNAPSDAPSSSPTLAAVSQSSMAPSAVGSDAPSRVRSTSPSLDIVSKSSMAPSATGSDAPSYVQSTPPSLAIVSQSSMAPSGMGSNAPSHVPSAIPTFVKAVEVAKLRINVKTNPFCYKGKIVVVPKDELKNNLPDVQVTLDIAAPAGPLTLTKTSNAKGKAVFRNISVNKTPGDSEVTACVSNGLIGSFCKKSFITVCD